MNWMGGLPMNVRAILDGTVKALRTLPAELSGDDSPLVDVWEEVKEQVQHGLSVYWPAYLETISGIVRDQVSSLSDEDRAALAEELRVPGCSADRLYQAIIRRLMARARKEKISYRPFDFRYFRYAIGDMSVYAEVIRRTGMYSCEVMAYSSAAPSGEWGVVSTDIIHRTVTAEEFKRARQRHWSD
jgi:hypothetical protein